MLIRCIFSFANTTDDNGYFLIEWMDGYNQTFASLHMGTNLQGSNIVNWYSDTCFEYEGDCISCVNPVSYTSDVTCDGLGLMCSYEGMAHQTMAVWEEMIGDTITVYSEFTDWCNIQYVDSLKVVVKNEF